MLLSLKGEIDGIASLFNFWWPGKPSFKTSGPFRYPLAWKCWLQTGTFGQFSMGVFPSKAAFYIVANHCRLRNISVRQQMKCYPRWRWQDGRAVKPIDSVNIIVDSILARSVLGSLQNFIGLCNLKWMLVLPRVYLRRRWVASTNTSRKSQT